MLPKPIYGIDSVEPQPEHLIEGCLGSQIICVPGSRQHLVIYNDKITRFSDISFICKMEHISYVTKVRFSMDGRYLATSTLYSVQIFDSRDGRRISTLFETYCRFPPSFVLDIVFTPYDRHILCALSDGNIIICDVDTWKREDVKIYGENYKCSTFSLDGSLLISVDHQEAIWRFDLILESQPRFCKRFVGFLKDPVQRLAISTDKTVIAIGANRTIDLWDIEKGTLLVRSEVPTSDGLTALLKFTLTGRQLYASWGHSLYVLDLTSSPKNAQESKATTSVPLSMVPIPGTKILSHSSTPDGKWILAGDSAGCVCLWSSDGEPQFLLRAHEKFSKYPV